METGTGGTSARVCVCVCGGGVTKSIDDQAREGRRSRRGVRIVELVCMRLPSCRVRRRGGRGGVGIDDAPTVGEESL